MCGRKPAAGPLRLIQQVAELLPGFPPGSVELVCIHEVDYTPARQAPPTQTKERFCMKDQEDYLSIPTPENIAFGYPLAGIGSRFIAALADTALILAAQAIILALSALLAVPLSDRGLTGFLLAVLGLISFGFLWGYYIFFEMIWNGQSPGKRLTGLRVIRTDGAPISLAESAIRNLVRYIDFLPLFYGIGVIVMFVDSRARRLGDLAAGTLVVREKGAPIRLQDLESPGSPRSGPTPSLPGYGELPVDKLREQDIDLVRSFLKRKGEIANAAALESQILLQLFTRMDLPVPDLPEHRRIDLLRQIFAARQPE